MVARYSGRKITGATTTMSCNGHVREAKIVNLSVPGCQLRTNLRLQKGQCLQLDIHLSHQPPMRVELGIVRWATDGEAGIEFIRMPDKDASRLRWYVGYVEKRPERERHSFEARIEPHAVRFV